MRCLMEMMMTTQMSNTTYKIFLIYHFTNKFRGKLYHYERNTFRTHNPYNSEITLQNT